jgi:hypothetical protein
MKFSHSFPGGFWKGPPMGMCEGMFFPALPATPRGIELTMTVAPMKGA